MRYKRGTRGLEQMVKEKEHELWIVVPDVHAPYHDKESYNAILSFVREHKPEGVVFIGDVVDNYSVSKYDKNPERANRLQEELDSANSVLSDMRKAAKDARIIYIEGNHEARMQKFLWRHPEIHGLRNLQLPVLLGVKDLDIDYRKEYVWKDTFMFTHGTRVNKYAARAELDDHGISGISGHTHHVQTHMKKDYTGEKVWHSIGHICDEKQCEYTERPDWQQAFAVVMLHKRTRRFYSQVIPITEHKFLYDGKVYGKR